jgi:phage tail-like protein
MRSPSPNSFWQLPRTPQPPDDPTWWLLNGRTGWHDAKLDNVALAGGRLCLVAAPGSGRLLNETSGSFGGLVPPGNVAVAGDGVIYLLDSKLGHLKWFDPCDCKFKILPCLGGMGSGPRQIGEAHSIAICSGNLFICDTGNRRLLVFSLRGLVLRDIWAPPKSPELVQKWKPYAVACDHRGRVYVSDPANGCVHRFHPSGRWEGILSGFGAVQGIAVDCHNRLYAVMQDQSAVRITDLQGKLLGTASRPEDVASLFPRLPFTVDARGDLGLSSICTPSGFSSVFNPQGEPFALDNVPKDPAPAFATSGTFWSEALDSEFYRCQWHRVVLRGRVAPKTSIVISTYTSEVRQPLEEIPDSAWKTNPTVTGMRGEWEGLIFSGPGRYLWLRLQMNSNGAATPAVESIKLEFPRISLRRYLPAAFGEDPGATDFTDRFLSIFDAGLRSIERKLDDEAVYFDPLSTPAVPKAKEATDFLTWLASWIGVSLDRQWPLELRRRILKQAGKLQAIRGTKTALWRQLLLLLGMQPESVCCPEDQPKTRCVSKPRNCAPREKLPCAWQAPPLILENYQLRRWMFLGSGRLGDDAVLWGKRIIDRSQLGDNAQTGVTKLLITPDPYHDPFLVYSNRFSVFVPATFASSDPRKRALINLLEAEKPAHTQYQLEYVAPRFRIGFQSMIGLDSVVGRYPVGFTLGAALGLASVLSGSAAQPSGPSFEIGGNSRIGSTTKLD